MTMITPRYPRKRYVQYQDEAYQMAYLCMFLAFIVFIALLATVGGDMP
jgi:hypothetical protein